MTDRITKPPGWTHKSGYRLDADGQAIRYEHDSGITAYIEGMVNEDPDDPVEFEYRPTIFDTDGSFLEYPEVFIDKAEALAQLEQWMDEYTDRLAESTDRP